MKKSEDSKYVTLVDYIACIMLSIPFAIMVYYICNYNHVFNYEQSLIISNLFFVLLSGIFFINAKISNYINNHIK